MRVLFVLSRHVLRVCGHVEVTKRNEGSIVNMNRHCIRSQLELIIHNETDYIMKHILCIVCINMCTHDRTTL